MKKTVALVTILAFCLYTFGCFNAKKVQKEPMNPLLAGRWTGMEVTAVQLKSGKTVQFPKGHSGAVSGQAVSGDALAEVKIPKAEVKSVRRNAKGWIVEIALNDGTSYPDIQGREVGEEYVFLWPQPISIPLADIELIWVKKPDREAAVGSTVLIVVAVVVGGVLLTTLLLKAMLNEMFADSCPFIYSYDGEQYVLDAEPYGTAICEALKRTEYASLDNLRETDGRYKLRIANELDETQYTDELKLIAVDHPPGVQVAPDASGRFHAFPQPVAPLMAREQSGRDIRGLVSANDMSFWVSRVEGRDPAKAEDLRDELVLEFPKPAGAAKAKLLANAWTTLWGSKTAEIFLKIPGSQLPEVYSEVNRRGPLYGRFLKWQMNEELYLLKVWVETKDGWKVKAVMNGGGPFISKDKAYVLDIGDVPGDTLRIKLRPPVNYWMLNALAVDYSEDITVPAAELEAGLAVDMSGSDIRSRIAATDGDYLVAPNKGDWAEVVFTAPPLAEGLDRTVFVKASGYYDIHLEASGEPRMDVLDRLLAEPGFATRLALEEYLQMMAAAGAAAGKR